MSRPLIEIKFAKLDCLDIVVRHGTPEDISTQLAKRLGTSTSPYQGEPAVLNISEWPASLSSEDVATLYGAVEHVKAALVQLVGLKSTQADHEVIAEALKLHWIEASDALAPEEATAASDQPTDGAHGADQTEELPAQAQAAHTENIPETPAPGTEATHNNASEPASEPSLVPPATYETIVIDGPVRSGQKIYARGGDAVVLGQVSPGAEIIADGHIHVYGPLRGRALAGANGNRSARIVATSFSAELVAVAGFYMTFEGGFPVNTANQPTQIYLDVQEESSNLRIEPINIR